jgi:hypothetical protein
MSISNRLKGASTLLYIPFKKGPGLILIASLITSSTAFAAQDTPRLAVLVEAAELDQASTLEDIAQVFMPGAHWHWSDSESIQADIRATLTDHSGTQESSVFHPDADIGPLGKAYLLAQADADLPHVRYRWRYAKARLDPPSGPQQVLDLVEVARFNLGPARHQALSDIHGEALVAPKADFGEGADKVWRLITRPIMGQAADILYTGWRELPESHGVNCLGEKCQTAEGLNHRLAPWPEANTVDALMGAFPMALQLIERSLAPGGAYQGDPSSASAWRDIEWPESAAAGQSFIEITLEKGVGQEAAIDLVVFHDQLMDHETRAYWRRLTALDVNPGMPPKVLMSQRFIPWESH